MISNIVTLISHYFYLYYYLRKFFTILFHFRWTSSFTVGSNKFSVVVAWVNLTPSILWKEIRDEIVNHFGFKLER